MAVREPWLPFLTTFDVSAGLPVPAQAAPADLQAQTLEATRQLLAVAQEQLTLSRQMAALTQQIHQQRHAALQRWQKENPRLVRQCREAVAVFEKVQRAFLQEMTQFIVDNEESLLDADFVLNEFSDRFGPRLMHLTGVLTLLQQLASGQPETPEPGTASD